MTRSEKIAVARIFSELIKADHIIDTGEMECWSRICAQHAIGKAEEAEAQTVSFAQAISVILQSSDPGLRKNLLENCASMTVSDGFCAHSEALIMIALYFLLEPDIDYKTDLYSIPRANFNVDTATAIYIESEYDPETNSAIQKDYRAIFKELQLVGFHLIYLPYFIEHYKNASPELIRQVLSFLAPSMSAEGIENAYRSLAKMTTASFSKDLLCNKCGISDLRSTFPSLLIKINNSYVGERAFANYLKIEVDEDILLLVQKFVDRFSSMLSSDLYVVKTYEERDSRFNYHGFYKQLLDLFLIRKNIRSKIVIDPYRQEIFFPDIDASCRGMNRRDRVLYALLLCSGTDGLNFTRPATASESRHYERRMQRLQSRYQAVYEAFGGEKDAAPDLQNGRNRSPILSNIRKAIRNLEGLYNPDDYNVTDSRDGRYAVNVEPEIVYVVELNSDEPVPLTRSALYNKVMSI